MLAATEMTAPAIGIRGVDYKIGDHRNEMFSELQALCDQHTLWKNPLLRACEEGLLSKDDFQFLFSQYYYSRNFTRLLAALMVNCDNDFYRSQLSENLWEEGGGIAIEERHAEIFRKFLIQGLELDTLSIQFEPYTVEFFANYLNLCIKQPPLEASAILFFGTEAIVSRLYTVFRKGLIVEGVPVNQLRFFDIHIACDDEHAETLRHISESYQEESNWLERSKNAINSALNLRNLFFEHLYNTIQEKQRLTYLVKRAAKAPQILPANPSLKSLLFNTDFQGNILYQNEKQQANIAFTVERVPCDADILDPRLVNTLPCSQNEMHSHAHETVFLILEGQGIVVVGEHEFHVKSGDIVFVPRWIPHQTQNPNSKDFKYFAITDYGFTKSFPANSESVYRMNNK